MENNSRKDIRRLLKTFGIQADEAIIAYLARHPDVDSLHIRITLEDLTDYGAAGPAEELRLQIEDVIQR
jgi:hypothetical protein